VYFCGNFKKQLFCLMNKMRKLFLLIWIIAGAIPLWASSMDNVRISLLTCAPGTEIYALFGHTAIRYENPEKKQDWVYNYGMFSFNEPNFVWRFVKGETDYQLGRIPFRYFEAEYAYRGSSVFQQVLNLTNEEKMKLTALLEENYRPANRVYRYNYFYDNCTTRARDKIEESIDGQVSYPKSEEVKTFRGIIHEYTKGSEWSEFGIDLCLGASADKPIDIRQQMFSPFYMMDYARGTMIHRKDTIVPLVLEELEIVKAELENVSAFFISPLAFGWILFLVSCVTVGWGVGRRRITWIWDALLFGAQGIGGIVIAFLFFFSVHPTVDTNWMILLFNPMPLFYLPWMIFKNVKGKKDRYHWVNAGILTLFMILMPFIQQKFNLTVLPLALSLWLTSVGHLYIYNKE